MPAARLLFAALPPLLLGLSACAPALDWRVVRPEGSTLEALFPCRPVSHERRLVLAGAETGMTMFACSAEGSTYAVSVADVAEPARVGVALEQMRAAARANLRGQAERSAPAAVPGMTPNAQAERLSLHGTLPDGRAVRQESVFFAHATRVYQASIVGPQPPPEAVEAFFSGLKLAS